MRNYFSTISEAQKTYPNFYPVSTTRKCIYHHHHYMKCGEARIPHNATWKTQRIFLTVCFAALAITVIPLFMQPYRKLMSKLWKQGLSGKEDVSVYILTSDEQIPALSHTSIKVAKLIKQIEAGKLDNNGKKLQSLTNGELAILSSLKIKTLTKIFPKPQDDSEAKWSQLRNRLSYVNEKVISRLVEEGELDNYSYILLALSAKQISSLTKLTKTTLSKIYPEANCKVAAKKWIEHLDEKVISKLVESGELDDYPHILEALSNKQLSALTTLSKTTLIKIFPNNKRSELETRIHHLNVNVICKLVADNEFMGNPTDDYILRALSEEQLAALPQLSKEILIAILPNPDGDKTKEAELTQRLSCLNKNLVCQLVEAGLLDKEDYLLHALSKEHLGNLSKLTVKTLNAILETSKDTEVQERYAQLPWNVVRDIIEGKENLDLCILQRLPEGRLKSIDFSKMSKEKVKYLFLSNKQAGQNLFMKLSVNQLEILKSKLKSDPSPKSVKQKSSKSGSTNPFNFNFFSTSPNSIKFELPSFHFNFFSANQPPINTNTTIPLKDAYKILGLPDKTSLEAVKKQYKILALKWHPDKVIKEADETEENFKKRQIESSNKFAHITNAYETVVKSFESKK
jgi:DnaJ domain